MADPVLGLPKPVGEKRRTTCYMRALRSGNNVNLKSGKFAERIRCETVYNSCIPDRS